MFSSTSGYLNLMVPTVSFDINPLVNLSLRDNVKVFQNFWCVHAPYQEVYKVIRRIIFVSKGSFCYQRAATLRTTDSHQLNTFCLLVSYRRIEALESIAVRRFSNHDVSLLTVQNVLLKLLKF